jgi:hypothetical protein
MTDDPQNRRTHHPFVELIHSQHETAEKVDRLWEQVGLGRTVIQTVMGGRAFRKYDALSGVIGLNKITNPNLRGMVVSARWHILFRHMSEVGEYMENVGYLAALASGIAESAPNIEQIIHSSGSATFKGMQLTATAGTAAQRALLGVVPAGAHLIYRSLEGWCMIDGLVGGKVGGVVGAKAQAAASQCIDTLRHADTLLRTSFRIVTETGNQSKALWWVIDLVTSRRPK